MTESYNPYKVSLDLWPVTSLPGDTGHELARLGVDISQLQVNQGRVTASRTVDGSIAIKLSLDNCRRGLTDLAGILTAARQSGLSYVAWDFTQNQTAGSGCSYDADSRVEHEFTVLADGEPVLTARDLDALEHYGTADALPHEARSRLHPPLPETTETLSSAEMRAALTKEQTAC